MARRRCFPESWEPFCVKQQVPITLISRAHGRPNNYEPVGSLRGSLNADVYAFVKRLKAETTMMKNILYGGDYHRFGIKYRTLQIAELVDDDIEVLPQETPAPFSTPNEIHRKDLVATGRLWKMATCDGLAVP